MEQDRIRAAAEAQIAALRVAGRRTPTMATIVIGVNKPVIIGHGGSSAKAISSMIVAMERNIESGVCDKIREAFKDVEVSEE